MATTRVHENYSADEINALRGIFALYDPEKSGSISAAELEVRMDDSGSAQEGAERLPRDGTGT